MARYLVHVKGEGAGALEQAVFVRDGFAYFALVFGPFWLLAKGAWISAVLAMIVFALFGFGLALAGLGMLTGLVFFLLSALISLENGVIRGWELRLRGYREAALVSGDDHEVIERRFFAEASATDEPASVASPVPMREAGLPVIGLFPVPPRRETP
jgi:hypothetical protein